MDNSIELINELLENSFNKIILLEKNALAQGPFSDLTIKEFHAIEAIGLHEKTMTEAAKILDDERRHEKELYNMLDEERLHYIGAMVLGLNDALVELTGAIAGVTFALANTRLVALTGIITGVSATFSMAASNYLAERADNNPKALKSSIYTGMAYLVTVALLVLPYLLFPIHFYSVVQHQTLHDFRLYIPL